MHFVIKVIFSIPASRPFTKKITKKKTVYTSKYEKQHLRVILNVYVYHCGKNIIQMQSHMKWPYQQLHKAPVDH